LPFVAPHGCAAVWTDPDKAAAEQPDFLAQGEYAGEREGGRIGLQAAALGGGRFLVSTHPGGLPGAGGDPAAIESRVLDREALKQALSGLQRVERVSPTEGREAPEGAEIRFHDGEASFIQGPIREGLLWPPAATTRPVGDFEMHVEFRLPFKPDPPPGHQDRGNSGLYIFDNYECQILDSFALAFNEKNRPIQIPSDPKQWGGCLYTFKTADVNMSYPPLRWQTYDIRFTAPVFTDGKKTKNARITVLHNGVKIHDDVELPKGTGLGGSRPEKPRGPILFQDHGNPVAFRNVWVIERNAHE
jgi:hypothetical protein